MEDCRLAMDWKAVKRRRKEKEIRMTFFIIRLFSDLISSSLICPRPPIPPLFTL